MQICSGIVEFVDSDRVPGTEGGQVGGGRGGPRVVLVQPVQVIDGQQDAQAVDEDPDDIEDIVSVGPLAVTALCFMIISCTRLVCVNYPNIFTLSLSSSKTKRSDVKK